MNNILGIFITLIVVGFNGLLYYWAYCCFIEVLDKLNESSVRVFNWLFFMVSFGLAGLFTIGFFTLVSIK